MFRSTFIDASKHEFILFKLKYKQR
jgi:hypothetical protein